MCQPERQEMSELLPDGKRSLVRLLLLLFKRHRVWIELDCGRLTHFGTCWVNNLLSLASYLGAHAAMIHSMVWPRKIAYCMPWGVVGETPHLVDCRLVFCFNSSTFSLLTGLSPQQRKPHVTATELVVVLDLNAWTNSLLTAGKWRGEFFLILL